jgi:hypothetical protein
MHNRSFLWTDLICLERKQVDQDRDPLPLEILSPCKKYNAMKFLLRNLIGMGHKNLKGRILGCF